MRKEDRSGNLFDRLYHEAEEIKRKQEEREKEDLEVSQVDQETGKKLFQPSINRHVPKYEQRNSHDEFTRSMLSKSMEYKRPDLTMDYYDFSPRINPNSLQLVQYKVL